ncbi:hypothetical protein NIES4101_78920 [Calothrix sp. NIES-4101]|nr:hypothetical protein NIES4101_78920 [Calothrix sp. NIES-4101]
MVDTDDNLSPLVECHQLGGPFDVTFITILAANFVLG